MKQDYLYTIAQLVLPSELLDYFVVTGVEQASAEIHISLDEGMSDELSNGVNFESKGAKDAVKVTDFPIRDHKVTLHLRRRWADVRTSKSLSLPLDIDVVAKGTRYSKEFAAFLGNYILFYPTP